ncbi:hypothetical protein EVAR_3731_1 [Eumeta japonica]|uniref:Uncharacterized protein n=1 Tax=Eumeta variegata TaxID=151549 RepID=A0A4C1SUC3_EUMVA|nr:hypothetical protein EVAR_3731_1 [Eumeta japonica]
MYIIYVGDKYPARTNSGNSNVHRNAWTELCGDGAGNQGPRRDETDVCARAYESCRFAKRLMMELEGGHRNSVIKRRNPIEFGLV